MKMEVLAVQQQYQTQYGGLGSNKIRDWTSTLTPPLSVTATASPTTPTTNKNSSTTSPLTMTVKTSAAVAAAMNANNSINNLYIPTISNNNSNGNSGGGGSSSGSSSCSSTSSNNSSTATTPYHHPHLYHHHNLHHHHHRQMATTNKMKNSIINKKTNRTVAAPTTTTTTTGNKSPLQSPLPLPSPSPSSAAAAAAAAAVTVATKTSGSSNSSGGNCVTTTSNSNNFFYCDNNDIDAAAVDELSLRLLNELRAAKSRHLTCTEVSLPCDLTPSIASEIIRVSEKEPCGIRGCTIYIEFEDEPNNSRRIASLKLDPETVSTFEVYLTLRQDHRGWTALLPQFMKNLARTITISPEFTITKHKLYSPQQRNRSSSNGSNYTASTAISTPSS